MILSGLECAQELSELTNPQDKNLESAYKFFEIPNFLRVSLISLAIAVTDSADIFQAIIWKKQCFILAFQWIFCLNFFC